MPSNQGPNHVQVKCIKKIHENNMADCIYYLHLRNKMYNCKKKPHIFLQFIFSDPVDLYVQFLQEYFLVAAK